MIYLAPIQGFTDYIYRKAFSEVFTDIDAFFIPYISVKNKEILKKYKKEILPENNLQTKVIPQVLVNNESEILFLAKVLKDYGYSEINLNLGCPYPMVTRREKGSGLLPYPEKIEALLYSLFEKTDLQLSVKLRAGLESPAELENIIPLLNNFPLTEVILHPRIARQLYSGNIHKPSFHLASKNLKHKLVYNGDIFSESDYIELQKQFPKTKALMLGRGVLMNPFLPAEINRTEISEIEKVEKLKEFQQIIFDLYSEKMDNPGNTLNKLKQFWSYFSYNFSDQKKVFKRIKKTRNLTDYNLVVKQMFLSIS